jgi:hypothetical protein
MLKGNWFLIRKWILGQDEAKSIDFLNNNLETTFNEGISFQCYGTFANEEG